MNMSTGELTGYTCSPELAVLCAHAQGFGDYNTWAYEETYPGEVQTSRSGDTVWAGHYCALTRQGREKYPIAHRRELREVLDIREVVER